MDILKGAFDAYDDSQAADSADEDYGHDAPPSVIGQDERRMQVRAYNHWASLLEDRNFPAIDDLEPDDLPDFGPYSVLLDFSSGIENPGIAYLGEKLAEECDATGTDLKQLDDVPSRSLLSRITDHYMQILANQAPIGFEAEFVNQRGATIMYRGILLPFSSDDETIDFIYGVINWKELADAQSADELLLEIDQALEAAPQSAAMRNGDRPLTDWADGPGTAPANDFQDEEEEMETEDDGFALPRPSFGFNSASFENNPAVAAGSDAYDSRDEFAEDEADDALDLAEFAESAITQVDMAEIAPEDMGLGDWLAIARELAAEAKSSEERTRNALYEAISRAYDFSLAAADEPDAFEELLADSGLVVQERAPMTPVVKLVFGVDYDKTRVTEFATALSHAHRLEMERGTLAEFLRDADGGLKGIVAAERRLRRHDAGEVVEPAGAPRERLANRLRDLSPKDFNDIAPQGSEFALVMIRRTDEGEVVMLGEVPDDVALVERAAKRLLD